VRYLVISGAIVVLFIILIQTWVLTLVKVQGRSMEPAYKDKTYHLIYKLAYISEEPRKGDVISFREQGVEGIIGLDMIGRVAGVPGEQINGVVLQDEEFYILGDNPIYSNDSRKFGPVEMEDIKGKFVTGK